MHWIVGVDRVEVKEEEGQSRDGESVAPARRLLAREGSGGGYAQDQEVH